MTRRRPEKISVYGTDTVSMKIIVLKRLYLAVFGAKSNREPKKLEQTREQKQNIKRKQQKQNIKRKQQKQNIKRKQQKQNIILGVSRRQV